MTREQKLPNDVLRLICSYERGAFMYTNKLLHAEYIKCDTLVYRECIIEDDDDDCRLNIMLVWYEFAERKNTKLYRYILRSMWPQVRSHLSAIYDRAIRFSWSSFYYRAKHLRWARYV